MADATRAWLPLSITAAGATDIGRSRAHNEDAVLLRPELALWVLADGAGGHNAGNVASALATTAIANYVEHFGPPTDEIDPFGTSRSLRRLATALQKANRDIIDIARSSNKLKGMGSTAVAIQGEPTSGMLNVAYVGDSRLYRLRDDVLEQLSFDHSLHNDALEMRPDVPDAVLARMPRNVVTRALGMDEAVRVSARSWRMLAEDRYLVCSDGLTDAVDDEDIATILGVRDRPENIVRALIQAALAAGAPDNIAVVVLQVELGPDACAPVKRPSVRPAGPSMTHVTEGSAPEIVILDMKEVRLDRSTGTIVVVPAQSAQSDMMGAIGELARHEPEEDPDEPKA
jgi:protein phosphatase